MLFSNADLKPSTTQSGIPKQLLRLLIRWPQAQRLPMCRSMAGMLRSIYLTDAFLCQGMCHHGEYTPTLCVSPAPKHCMVHGLNQL